MRRQLLAAVALAVALLLTGCVHKPPVVVPPIVQPPVMCGLTVHVFHGDPVADHKVPNARVVVADRVAVTDGAGNTPAGALGLFVPNRYLVSVSADGYLTVKDQAVELCTDTSIQVVLPPVPAPVGGRTGRVRLVGRAFVDDQGPSLALGTSLFYGVHATHDMTQLQANLKWFRDHGGDFVRVFGETEGWDVDAIAGPLSTPDYPGSLRIMRDAAMTAGLKIEWTLFSSDELSNVQQDALASTLVTVSNEKPESVQLIEISNEGWGMVEDVPFYTALAQRFVDAGFPTAITSTAHYPGAYAGRVATVGTEHFERTFWEDGWRPVRQPWGYWEEQDVPARCDNNEPIGIGSSVAQDADPLRLIMGAVLTWVSGCAAHVVHTGAGVTGVPNTHPVGGYRPANLWEQPTLEPTLAGIAAMRFILPPDLANWTRVNANRQGHPFVIANEAIGDPALKANFGCDRAYSANAGGRFVVTVIGIMGQVTLTPTSPMDWTVYNPLNGAVLATGSGALTLREAVEGRAVVILGIWN